MHADSLGRHPSRLLRRLALVIVALSAIGCGAGGGGASSIGFGTGGIDCELESVASTFPAGATVRLVARFDPLPDSVTVKATKDGAHFQGPDTVDLDGTVPCIYGNLPDLAAGHYEFVVTNPDSKMPPLRGDFEVTAR